MITIKETTQRDLVNVKQLWADGDVMKFVGFPNGLHETDEGMSDWFDWILSARPKTNHFSIFDDGISCALAYNILFKSLLKTIAPSIFASSYNLAGV